MVDLSFTIEDILARFVSQRHVSTYRVITLNYPCSLYDPKFYFYADEQSYINGEGVRGRSPSRVGVGTSEYRIILYTHWLAREEDASNTISSSSLARLPDLTNLGPRDTREKVYASSGAIYFTS